MAAFQDPRVISSAELFRRKQIVESCYKAVNDYGERTMGGQASSASDGAAKGHQGETRMRDLFRVTKALAELDCFSSKDKVTIDVGAGCGKPGLLFSGLTQCTTIGIEQTPSRVDFNMIILKQLHDKGLMPERHFNVLGDATEFSLHGVNTVHFYCITVPPDVLRGIAERFNESETVEILCLYYDSAGSTLEDFVRRVTASTSKDGQHYNFMVDPVRGKAGRVEGIRLYHGVDSLNDEDYEAEDDREEGATDKHVAVFFKKSDAGKEYAREYNNSSQSDGQRKAATTELINFANGPMEAKAKKLEDEVNRINYGKAANGGHNGASTAVKKRESRPPERLGFEDNKKAYKKAQAERGHKRKGADSDEDEDSDEDADSDEDEDGGEDGDFRESEDDEVSSESEDDDDEVEVSDGMETFTPSDVFHDNQLSEGEKSKKEKEKKKKREEATQKAKKKKKVEADGALVEAPEARAEGNVTDIEQGLRRLPGHRATEMRERWHNIFIAASSVVQDREDMINAILKLLPSRVDHIRLDDDASIEKLKSIFFSFEFIPPWIQAVLRPANDRLVFDQDAASDALSKCFEYLSTSERYQDTPVHGKYTDELLEMMQDEEDDLAGEVQNLFFLPRTKAAKEWIRALLDQDKGSSARHYLQNTVSTQFNRLFTENVVRVRIFIHARLAPRFQNL